MAYAFKDDKSQFAMKEIAQEGMSVSGDTSRKYVIYSDNTFEYDLQYEFEYGKSNFKPMDNTHYETSGAIMMLPSSVFRQKVVSDETINCCIRWKSTGNELADVKSTIYGFALRNVNIESDPARIPYINWGCCMIGTLPSDNFTLVLSFHITGKIS